MKLISVFFTSICLLTNSMYGDSSTDWISYKKEVINELPKIPGWCSSEKANRMMELAHNIKPQIYVEIGIFGGSSFYPMTKTLQYNENGVSYAIDPWDVTPCLEGENIINQTWWSKVDLNKIMRDFIDLMHKNNLDPYYSIMRMTSSQAVSTFNDESIDILHIDGNHSEDSAFFDAVNWLPKVKKEGYIFFDDTDWSSTQKAVQYLLQYCDMDPESHLGDSYILFKKR